MWLTLMRNMVHIRPGRKRVIPTRTRRININLHRWWWWVTRIRIPSTKMNLGRWWVSRVRVGSGSVISMVRLGSLVMRSVVVDLGWGWLVVKRVGSGSGKRVLRWVSVWWRWVLVVVVAVVVGMAVRVIHGGFDRARRVSLIT